MADNTQAATQQASSMQSPGDMLYQKWLSAHPSAPAIEKDVMRKAFGGRTQVSGQSQFQDNLPPVQMNQPASGAPASAPAPSPAPKQQAIGRALQQAS